VTRSSGTSPHSAVSPGVVEVAPPKPSPWPRLGQSWQRPGTAPCTPTSSCCYLRGARTEELRALTWDHVDLLGRPDTQPPIPPHIAVWRSVRAQGETKTRKSRRTIALPIRCVDVLSELRRQQVTRSGGVGPNGLVFSTATGGPMDAANVRRAFRSAIARRRGSRRDSGLRESCKQIRPVIQTGAVVLDAVFGSDRDSHADRHAAVVEPDVSGDGHARDQGL
jgi:integrase